MVHLEGDVNEDFSLFRTALLNIPSYFMPVRGGRIDAKRSTNFEDSLVGCRRTGRRFPSSLYTIQAEYLGVAAVERIAGGESLDSERSY